MQEVGTTWRKRIVESLENGKWVADRETGLFIFPFWKPKKVCYLQNNLIASATDS